MSEIELQGLLDMTSSSDEDEEAMDVVVIDNFRVSEFDIRAIKVGKKQRLVRVEGGVEYI